MSSPNTEEVSSVPNEINSGENAKFLSDIQVRPEAEALLRAVFRALDPDDTGLVPASLLIESLGLTRDTSLLLPSRPSDSSTGNVVSDIRRDRDEQQAADSTPTHTLTLTPNTSDNTNANSGALGNWVKSALGSISWEALVTNLLTAGAAAADLEKDESVSWGEVPKSL